MQAPETGNSRCLWKYLHNAESCQPNGRGAPKLLPAKQVKAFVLRDNTHARNAQAIWVAVRQPHIRDVLFIQRAASGLSGFAPNHIPYYRQEQINARSGVNTPRSTLAVWSGQTGAQLMPLYEAHRAFVLCSSIEHADETPISMLDPGAGKTRKAYMWAYARGGRYRTAV